jgi:hypothetical protein
MTDCTVLGWAPDKSLAVLESIEGDRSDGFKRLLKLLREVAKGAK